MNWRRLKTLSGLFGVCALTLAVQASVSPGSGANPQTKGFVVTRLVAAMYEGATGRTADWNTSDGRPECPDGFNVGPDWEAVLAKQPAAERARLRKPENTQLLGETFWLVRHRGQNNRDVCDHPTSAPDPGFKVVQGKTAYGFDLDNSDGTPASKYTCAHDNFTGPDGEKGIDNQLYRVFGCTKSFRQGGFMHGYFNALMRQGDHSVLIEITGVDDVKNDEEVTVGIYAGQDPMVNNVDDVSLSNASLAVHYNRNYHSETRGKIVNGILTTEPVNVQFDSPPERPRYNFRDARLRAELLPDGTLRGLLGAYVEVKEVYRETASNFVASELSVHGPMTCPGLHYALRRMADGYPDIPGGQCEWISAAYELEAIPAFVIHPKEGRGVGTRTARVQGEAGTERWWRKLLWWQ